MKTLPVSTIRYFAKSAYQHYYYHGKTPSLVNKTVHVDGAGNTVYIRCEVIPRDRIVAYGFDWVDKTGKRYSIGGEMPIAKSWAY